MTDTDKKTNPELAKIGMCKKTGRTLNRQEHIDQCITDILTTPIGSRLQRREYGSHVFTLIDSAMNDAGKLRLLAAAVDAVNKWEPRVRLESAEIDVHMDGRVTLSYACNDGYEGKASLAASPSNDFIPEINITSINAQAVDADPFYDNLVLSIEVDEVGDQIIDISPNPKIIEIINDVVVADAVDVAYDAALKIQGVESYLKIQEHSDFVLDGDFTIELWFNMSDKQAHFNTMIASTQTSWMDGCCYLLANGHTAHGGKEKNQISFGQKQEFDALISVTKMNPKIWHHVAIVRDGVQLLMFVDGHLESSNNSQLPYDLSQGIIVGSAPWGFDVAQFMGLIDELRITKNVARYTQDFAPTRLARNAVYFEVVQDVARAQDTIVTAYLRCAHPENLSKITISCGASNQTVTAVEMQAGIALTLLAGETHLEIALRVSKSEHLTVELKDANGAEICNGIASLN